MEAKLAFIYQLQITHQKKKKKKNICVGVKLSYLTFYFDQYYQRIKRCDFCVTSSMLQHFNTKIRFMSNALIY